MLTSLSVDIKYIAHLVLVHSKNCYNALMQEMKLPLFYIGSQMRYRLWVLVF